VEQMMAEWQPEEQLMAEWQLEEELMAEWQLEEQNDGRVAAGGAE
jgi:hypothetical protein